MQFRRIFGPENRTYLLTINTLKLRPVTKFRHTTSGIRYVRRGKSRTAVIFIHGFLEDLHMWDGFVRRVPGYSSVWLDLYGFGGSSVPESCTMEDYAAGVHEVIETEAFGRVLLVGHSMGGYTALAYARRYPDKMAGLSLFHSHPYRDTKEIRAKRDKSIGFVQSHGVTAYAHATVPNLFAPAFRARRPEVVQRVTDAACRTSAEGVVAALGAMKKRKDTSGVLREAPFPVQFIIGSEDAAIPAELSLRQTSLPPIADIHIIERVGHMGHLEAPGRTKRAVRAFLDFCREVSVGE